VLQDARQALPLLADRPVQPGIVHGDGRLVGEALQYPPIVERGRRRERAKDIDHADEIIPQGQGQGHHLSQRKLELLRHAAQLRLKVGDHNPFPGIGDTRQQRGEHRHIFRRDADQGAHP